MAQSLKRSKSRGECKHQNEFEKFNIESLWSFNVPCFINFHLMEILTYFDIFMKAYASFFVGVLKMKMFKIHISKLS